MVTGGAGFIGSHIVDAYIKNGHRVIVVDNLSTGSRKNLNWRAKFYKADIRNYEIIKKIFQKEKPEIANHHAAISEVAKSLKNPTLTYEVNILGTANVLLAAGMANVKKFIFISSGGAVYGNQEKIPIKENAMVRPLSPYAFSKVIGEEFLKFYSASYGFNYLILRYANVYGPRQNLKGEAGVVAIFADLIKEGTRPKIFGDGTKTRDYVYIEDIIKANILSLKKGRNEVLNIGCGKEIGDEKVFKTLAGYIGFNKPPIYTPFRSGEVYRTALNSKKAQQILGWQPKISFEQGVKKYLASI